MYLFILLLIVGVVSYIKLKYLFRSFHLGEKYALNRSLIFNYNTNNVICPKCSYESVRAKKGEQICSKCYFSF
jgi:hypothetical protein